MPFLTPLLPLLPSLAKYLGIFLVLAGLIYGGYHAKAIYDERATLQAQLDQSKAQLAIVEQHAQAVTSALSKLSQAQADRARVTDNSKALIYAAPATDNGSLAVVTLDTLERLRHGTPPRQTRAITSAPGPP